MIQFHLIGFVERLCREYGCSDEEADTHVEMANELLLSIFFDEGRSMRIASGRTGRHWMYEERISFLMDACKQRVFPRRNRCLVWFDGAIRPSNTL